MSTPRPFPELSLRAGPWRLRQTSCGLKTGTLVKRGPWPCWEGTLLVCLLPRAAWAGFWVGMLTNSRCPGDPPGHAEGLGAGAACDMDLTICAWMAGGARGVVWG